jgi:Domain of unknown function (DUF4396)
MDGLREVLSSPEVLWIWAANAVLGLAWVGFDLGRHNRELGGWMKLVWLLTVLYSGLLGLAIYFYAGRRQIPEDTLPRKGFRSTAHCYSGCGAGEVIGVAISTGLFSFGQVGISLLTFALAYGFGLGLTIGPLLQDGEALGRALRDAVESESASIVVMEAVAIAVDLVVAGSAKVDDPLFWASLFLSLSVGLFAAFPVNLWLIRRGVKSGMRDPRSSGEAVGTAA